MNSMFIPVEIIRKIIEFTLDVDSYRQLRLVSRTFYDEIEKNPPTKIISNEYHRLEYIPCGRCHGLQMLIEYVFTFIVVNKPRVILLWYDRGKLIDGIYIDFNEDYTANYNFAPNATIHIYNHFNGDLLPYENITRETFSRIRVNNEIISQDLPLANNAINRVNQFRKFTSVLKCGQRLL